MSERKKIGYCWHDKCQCGRWKNEKAQTCIKCRAKLGNATRIINAVTNYWLDHFIDEKTGLCSLCGNTGRIDTTKTAISAAGFNAGRINFCICPNGMLIRKASE